MNRIRTFIPNLPRDAWLLLVADGVAALGHGLILPFFIVYLHRVRGIALDTAAFAFAVQALVGLGAGPIAGGLIDRIGARRTLFTSIAISAVGSVLIVFIREPWHAFAVAGVLGIGHAGFWPALQALLSSVVTPAQRSSVFSVQFAILNAGIGFGALAGGAIADISRPGTFEFVYIAEAVLVMASLVLMVVTGAGRRVVRVESHSDETPLAGGGYREVLRDRVFLRVLALHVFLVTVGYAQLESAFPPYATGEGGISTQALGLAFLFNTSTIVVAQLVVLKKLEGRRRTRALMVLFVLWAACWTLTLMVGELGSGGSLAVVGFCLAMVLFASGETLLSPTIPPIVNDLSPDHLRGRYNALYTLCWSLGEVVGPPIAGVALDRGRADVLFPGLVIACLIGAVAARGLERYLPARINIVRGDEEPEFGPKEPVAVTPRGEKERVV